MISKLTRMRVKYCGNGDECPALDRREEGGIEVTGQLVYRPDLPPGEATVLAPDTLFPEIVPLHVNLGTFIAEHHCTDLLRVQTLDYYSVTSDGEDYRRYVDGEPTPAAAGKQEWLDRLRTDTAAGRLRRNVHIVRSPLAPYLGYQFEWCYLPNTAAGQNIRVLDVTRTLPRPRCLGLATSPLSKVATSRGCTTMQTAIIRARSWLAMTLPLALSRSPRSPGAWPPRLPHGGSSIRSIIAATLRPELAADGRRPCGTDLADVMSCPALCENSVRRPSSPPATLLNVQDFQQQKFLVLSAASTSPRRLM